MSKEKKAPLDFSNLDSQAACEAGLIVELPDPRTTDESLLDDEGKPYWIEIIGLDSAPLRALARKMSDKRMNDIRKGKEAKYDSEIVEAEKATVYAAATRSWYVPTMDGVVLECNEKNAKKLYSDPRVPWIVEHLDKKIADRQLFFKKASPSS